MKHLPIILLALLIFTGCKLTKEERRLNRGTNKLERLVTKFPELKRTDTLLIDREVIVPRTQIDTVTTLTTDTVTVTKDRLTVRYRVDTIRNTVWLDAICDTLVIRDTVRVPYETIQPVRFEPTAKESQRTDRWRTVALVFVGISVVLGLTHWVRS